MVHRNASVPDTFTSDMSMTDSVVHEIDTIRWLFGQEIVATTVVASRPSPLGARPGLRDPQLVLLELDRRCGRQRRGLRQLPVRLRRALRGRRLRAAPSPWTTPAPASLLRRGRRGRGRSRRTGASASTWPTTSELQEWVGRAARGGVVGGPSAWDGYAAAVVAEPRRARPRRAATRVQVELVDRPALYR